MEHVGLPNQCFYCRKLGHMINGCPKRKSHQDSAPTEKMNQAHGQDKQQTMERQWIPVSGKRAFAPPSSPLVFGPDQHINNTYNVLYELEVENAR